MENKIDLKRFYDVIIIGGGPAGLTAALYLARARYRVLVIEKEKFGGQITITHEVVNFPGVETASGTELTRTMQRQAENFGASFLMATVNSIDLDGDIKKVHTDKGTFECFGILMATGAHPRMIGFPGEAEFRGRGVAYCATCDGEFFTDKEVFVVGGGFAAAEEAVFLTRYAKHVTILVREDNFTCAEAVALPAKNNPNITVHYNTEVDEVSGDDALRTIRYHNTKTGEKTLFKPDDDTFGVFVFAGYAPASGLVKDQVELNPGGYIVTDKNQKTSQDGVYAAGDVCEKNLRQVVTAVGDGALAATELERYAAAMQKKTGIIPEKPVRKETEKQSAQSAQSAQTARSARSGSVKTAEKKADGKVLSPAILSQLTSVFQRMEEPLILSLQLNDSAVSRELKQYMEELAEQTDKLSVRIEKAQESDLPLVRVLKQDGTDTGLAFHGVPGGHEFTSFVLGLYNASGPGQPIDPKLKKIIESISEPVDLQIFVSLSCTMCPDLVMAAQRMASLNPLIKAEVYDLNHFPHLKDQYHVMSVPCLVMNQKDVSFGKKNLQELSEKVIENLKQER